MALDNAETVAFVASTDLERSRAFYGGVLGLELLESNAASAVFDSHGTLLRVTLIEGRPVARYTVLGWRVNDIEQAMADLVSRGVVFERYEGFEQDAAGVWTAPSGSRIAWFLDPDRNTLSLEQRPA